MTLYASSEVLSLLPQLEAFELQRLGGAASLEPESVWTLSCIAWLLRQC